MSAEIITLADRRSRQCPAVPAQDDSGRLIRLLIRDIGRNLGIEHKFEPLPPEPRDARLLATAERFTLPGVPSR